MNKVSFFITALLFTGISGQAQINLIGSRGNQGTGVIDIVKWQALDQSSVTTYPTTLQAYVFGSSVFDAYNSNYYLNGIGSAASGLFSFNSITNEQNISTYNTFSSITEIDMSTGKIYNLSADGAGTININEYDINTGNEILLGAIFEPGTQGIIADATGFDSNSGILYYVGYDTLPSLCMYGIQVREPVFTYSKTTLIVTAPGNIISSVNYDNVNNTIYAMNAEYSAMGTYTGNKVIEIDKTTGEVINRGTLEGFNAFLAGSSSFDQNSGSFLLVGFDDNFAERMIVFNTYSNTYITGFVPGNVSEIVCDNNEFARNAYITTSVNQSEKKEVSVFPNPATTQIKIEGYKVNSGKLVAGIYDLKGKLVLQQSFGQFHSTKMDVSTLTPGIYILKTETDEDIQTQKLVIR